MPMDDGSFCTPLEICTDLESGKDLSDKARALPGRLQKYYMLFDLIGARSALGGKVPEVRVTAVSPSAKFLERAQASLNDPRLADVVFRFDEGPAATSAAAEEAPQELYAHKFVLGLSSPVRP